MKKIISFLFLFVLLISSMNVLALDDQRPFIQSKIPLKNKGSCSAFAEQMFHQRYGIYLNLPNNDVKEWQALEGKEYIGDNGKTYIIKFSKNPRINSIVLTTVSDYKKLYKKSTSLTNHVAWVKDVVNVTIYDNFNEISQKYDLTTTKQIYVLESGSSDQPRPKIVRWWHGMWYNESYYFQYIFPDVNYIYPEIKK